MRSSVALVVARLVPTERRRTRRSVMSVSARLASFLRRMGEPPRTLLTLSELPVG